MLDFFKIELEDKIFPFINSFQCDFKIHGNSHISRCLVYANSICNLENISDENKLLIFYAVAFHDSGRSLDFGEDKNDKANIEVLRKYLEKENKINLFIDIERLMYKSIDVGILSNIVYDTDVLDIMRIGCGRGGIYNFNKNFSKLIKNRDYCDSLIQECWQFINMTENNYEYDSVNSFNLMCDLIKENNFNLILCK